MIKILFICHGNICRSPMAEFVMKERVRKAGLEGAVYVESAAMHRDELGSDTHYGTKGVLDRYGVPYEPRAARLATKEDYERFDYLVGMDAYNMRDMRRLFKNNPEEFIRNVVKTIREQKATMIVEHISYNRIAGKYDSSIFVPERKLNINKVIEAQKHITPYIAFDSEGEKAFAEALEGATEVQVYAKLPRKLKIPTPVGNYAPDWAIVFNDGTVRHVFFVAETKGSLDGMELRGVEKAKTECAKKLFNRISTSKVRYGVVDKFENLYNLINGIG